MIWCIIFLWLVIHDTLIIPQKKTAVLLFGKIAAFFLGDFFYSPFLIKTKGIILVYNEKLNAKTAIYSTQHRHERTFVYELFCVTCVSPDCLVKFKIKELNNEYFDFVYDIPEIDDIEEDMKKYGFA